MADSLSHNADGTPAGSTINLVESYDADPTGAKFSDTAMAEALRALGSSLGDIALPAGTYKFNDSYKFGPGQGIVTGLDNTAVTLEYYGDGVFIHAYDPNFGVIGSSPGGVFSGFTIDGTNAGSAAKGFQLGDLNSPTVNIAIQNFTGATSIGAWFANVVGWSEYGTFRIDTYNNTANVVFDADGSGSLTSYDASVFMFTFILYPGQTGVIWQGSCQQYAGSLTLYGQCWGGSSNAGTVMNLGPDGSGAGVRNVRVDINFECGDNTGTVGPVSIALGSGAYFMQNIGSISFRNNDGSFQASAGLPSYRFSHAGWMEFDASGDFLGNAGASGFGLQVQGGSLWTGTDATYAGDGVIYNGVGDYFATTLASGANTYALANLVPGRAQKLIWHVVQPPSGAAGTLTLTGAKTTGGSGALTLSSTNGYEDVIEIWTPDGVNVYAVVLGTHFH
jgi:hypothetical protein